MLGTYIKHTNAHTDTSYLRARESAHGTLDRNITQPFLTIIASGVLCCCCNLMSMQSGLGALCLPRGERSLIDRV
jgi:hypothetical protein